MASEREKSPRRGMCAAIVSMEGLAVALATPVMISIGGVSAGLALPLGLGFFVACIVVAGMLRRPWAYWLGWALQVAAIAMGFLISIMFVVGVIFAILWGMADILGRKIESERAAAFEAYDRIVAEEDATEGTAADTAEVPEEESEAR
ncbi:hypothetical protein J2S40_000697 [Nocardioides luteus]|uniref:DUF4233 domain-containing protein n=1 Tax=Nocardioides luteus TaxID=1844 RepID=A0ABQ5T3X1_9ACTN|nr:DUF4233 domain-containing protein [Nocardioides luteus]MDR7309639.1 hypothetical protein [Nocardioides luteus]GGR70421.1 hypothetical protein GCM10010197_42330 [Nocardioides luteus]GLJ70578.1 hypothetical protein GCM10017579_46140 [Nocardioides luteus]